MQWLRALREARGMTQEEVALEAYMTQPSYSNIERGKHEPTPETAMRIADALGFCWEAFYDPSRIPDPDDEIVADSMYEKRGFLEEKGKNRIAASEEADNRRFRLGRRFEQLRQELRDLLEPQDCEERDRACELCDALYELRVRLEQLEESLQQDGESA